MGTPVLIDGVTHVVDEVSNGWVRLIPPDGSRLPLVPLRQVALSLTSDISPPPLSERALTALGRLSAEGAAKYEQRLGIVRWFETGLRPGQQADERPEAHFDPDRVPEASARITAISQELARNRGIKPESARRLILRTLEKFDAGHAGLIDPRMHAPGRHRQNEFLETWIREFLLAREFESTITDRSLYISFSAWLLVEHEAEAPPLRTFQRYRSLVYERYPHLRRKPKSAASTAVAPAVALQRRSAIRVGEYWLLDSTTSNVMLRDPYSPTGRVREYRPTLTKVIDGATRYIVGSSISEDANGLSVGLAIGDAFRAMVDDREHVEVDGRTYPRPFIGLPRAISRWPIAPRRLLLDNGKEFLNRHGMRTLERLGIDVEPARVRDGRAKADIERFFRTYKEGFEQQQRNYLGGSVDERGRDATSHVVLTWEQLLARDRQWTDVYNNSEHEGLRADFLRRTSPAALWVDLAHQQGVTETVAWRHEWIRFLPSDPYKLDPYGISRRRMIYNAPIIRALLETDGAAPAGRTRIFWDPNDLRQVYCFDPEGNAYEIPWVHRNEDTGPISTFFLDWASDRLEGASLSADDYGKAMRDLKVQWNAGDVVLIAQHEGRNAQEMLATQLDALRQNDSGSIRSAEPFFGREILEAYEELASVEHAGQEDEDQLLDDRDAPYDELFDEFV